MPEYPCIPISPLLAPPFHQISLPDAPLPPRKLQAVRLSILTLLAFHTTIPLRPTVLPLESVEPKVCWFGSALQDPVAPALVPSTITVDRFIPRTWMPEVVMITAPA